MKQLVILGAGSAGAMMANHLHKALSPKDWQLTVVDQEKIHYYQPGFLFLPFGYYQESDVVRPIGRFIPKGINLINEPIDRIAAADNQVMLENGQVLDYDILIVATGSRIAPEEVPGLLESGWRKDVFDFYTFEGARALRDKLATWSGGKLVVHITEMPIKCPVAPLEFAFLADDFFAKKGMRDKVEIVYVTPLSGAFTKPVSSRKLGHLLEEKNIHTVTDFYLERIDGTEKKLYDYGGQEVSYDLLVTVPTNKGADAIARSGLGDELNYIDTDKHTLQAKAFDNMFVLGDATNLPASKAGSVAHFEAEILAKNIERYIAGQPLLPAFDGHANCFIETGRGKALLIDFNYEVEPVTGTFPIAGLGPMRLLSESRINHWGKLAFRWIYWNMLLPGRAIPFITPRMKRAGKDIPQEQRLTETVH